MRHFTLLPSGEAQPQESRESIMLYDAQGNPIDLSGGVATGSDGKSAYQIAVDNGFVGTPVEWLASLEGPTGAPGPAPVYDTLGNRPPANTQADKTLFFATDDNGGTLYQVQGGAWAMIAPKSTELGYGQITANLAGLGTSFALLSGLTVPILARGNPVKIKGYIPSISNAAATANNFTIAIYKDGTQIQAFVATAPAIQFSGVPVNIEARDNPSVGTHTYAIYGKANVAANLVPVAALTNPAFIQVVEV